MNINFETLKEFIVPLIVLMCLIVGYCIKHIPKLEAVSNAYIPSILAVLGAVAYCYQSHRIDLTTIVAGAFSGLVAVGLHQTFAQLIDKNLKDHTIEPSDLAAAKEDIEAIKNEVIEEGEEYKEESEV